MLSCRQVTQRATDHLEGRLGRAERLGVSFHLLLCRHCRRFLRQLRATAGVLRRLKADAPSAEKLDALAARFRDRKRT